MLGMHYRKVEDKCCLCQRGKDKVLQIPSAGPKGVTVQENLGLLSSLFLWEGCGQRIGLGTAGA